MRIKNMKIRTLVKETGKLVIPFYYIKQNRSLFSLIPVKWESCQKCGVTRQGRFMYYYQSAQTLCRECTEAALFETVEQQNSPASINILSETTRSVIMTNLNWIKGQTENKNTYDRLGQVMDLFDIGANIVPALPILLEDKLPRGAKELLQGCIGPMLRILFLTDSDPEKPQTLIFTKENR